MKKEDLFDLLENVDEKYIEEALHDYDEYDSTKPIVVYQEKTRVTPLKIMAPIAACLAIVAAAGLVFTNKDKITRILRSNSSGTSATTSAAAPAASAAEPAEIKQPDDPEFVDKCKKIISTRYSFDENGTDVLWKSGMLDMDFDGEDELLICPLLVYDRQGGNHSITDVTVFKKTAGKPSELGSFALNHEGDFGFEDLYKTPGENSYYYYFNERYSTCDKEGMKIVTVGKFSDLCGEEVYERTGLNITVDPVFNLAELNDNYLDQYYNGEERVTRQEFRRLWKQYPGLPEISTPQTFFGYDAKAEALDIIAEKYGISRDELSNTTRSWTISDLNGYGLPDGLVMFDNFDKLPNLYAFEDRDNGVKFLGELDIKGRLLADIARETYNNPAAFQGADRLPILTVNDENGTYPYYITAETVEIDAEVDGEKQISEYNVFRINTREDHTVWSEKHLNYGRDPENGGRVFFRIGDRYVYGAEFLREFNKYSVGYDYENNMSLDHEMMLELVTNIYDKENISNYYNFDGLGTPEFISAADADTHRDQLQDAALFCRAFVEDYEISLFGEGVFSCGYRGMEPVYGSDKLFLALAKYGALLDVLEIKPEDGYYTDGFFTGFGGGFTPIIGKYLHTTLVERENNTVDLQFFNENNVELTKFAVENDKLVKVKQSTLKAAETDYLPLDTNDIPALNTYYPTTDDNLAAAELTTEKYGEYELRLVSNGLYTYTGEIGEGKILATDLALILSKNGTNCYFEYVITNTNSLRGIDRVNMIDPDKLDKLINFIELEDGVVITLTCDNADTWLYKLKEDGFEPIAPKESLDNQVPLSDDYTVHGNIIVDNGSKHQYTFDF